MDKLTVEEVNQYFVLKPYEIYRISQDEKILSLFQVYAFTIDEGICYVDLKFSDKDDIVTVEEEFFLNFLDENNLDLFAVRKEN